MTPGAFGKWHARYQFMENGTQAANLGPVIWGQPKWRLSFTGSFRRGGGNEKS